MKLRFPTFDSLHADAIVKEFHLSIQNNKLVKFEMHPFKF